MVFISKSSELCKIMQNVMSRYKLFWSLAAFMNTLIQIILFCCKHLTSLCEFAFKVLICQTGNSRTIGHICIWLVGNWNIITLVLIQENFQSQYYHTPFAMPAAYNALYWFQEVCCENIKNTYGCRHRQNHKKIK